MFLNSYSDLRNQSCMQLCSSCNVHQAVYLPPWNRKQKNASLLTGYRQICELLIVYKWDKRAELKTVAIKHLCVDWNKVQYLQSSALISHCTRTVCHHTATFGVLIIIALKVTLLCGCDFDSKRSLFTTKWLKSNCKVHKKWWNDSWWLFIFLLIIDGLWSSVIHI